MIDIHLRMLRLRDELSPEEEKAIRAAVVEIRTTGDGETMVREGDELHSGTMLLDGLIARCKDLSDGRRQITALHVAGEFVDLHGFTLRRLDHNLVTLSPCRIGIVPHQRLRQITEEHPHLTRLYWMLTSIDAAMHREWELSLGRRNAMSGLAFLLCEYFTRLEAVGRTEGDACDFPLRQADLADCLGLTAVHVNRILQDLRGQGLVELKGRRLTLLDRPALADVGEFTADHLYLDRMSR